MVRYLTVVSIIEHFGLVSGAILNLLLLFLINKCSRKELGEYKNLLTAFAGFDVFLCFAHWFISPKALSYGLTYVVVSNAVWESRHFAIGYCALFSIPLAIININFLYRYWSIKNPQRILLFSKRWFRSVLVTYALSAYTGWHLLCWYGTDGYADEPVTSIAREKYREKYNKTVIDGFLVMEHWHDEMLNFPAAVLAIGADVVMIVQLSVTGTIGGLTFYHIHKAKTDISIAVHALQKKLLIALCAQMSIPFVCVLFPYSGLMTLPLLFVADLPFADEAPIMLAVFPALDAIVIIMLMKDYREGLLVIFCRKQPTTYNTTIWKTVSSVKSGNNSQVDTHILNNSVAPLT